MISNTKKILIETDRTETLIVRTAQPVTHSHCPDCDAEVAMLDLRSAVKVSGCEEPELIGYFEGGRLHSSQTPDGRLLICCRSLHEII